MNRYKKEGFENIVKSLGDVVFYRTRKTLALHMLVQAKIKNSKREKPNFHTYIINESVFINMDKLIIQGKNIQLGNGSFVPLANIRKVDEI